MKNVLRSKRGKTLTPDLHASLKSISAQSNQLDRFSKRMLTYLHKSQYKLLPKRFKL